MAKLWRNRKAEDLDDRFQNSGASQNGRSLNVRDEKKIGFAAKPNCIHGDRISDDDDSPEGRAKGDQSLVLSTARTAERTLVALVDGKKTVQDLVRVSGMSDLVVRRHLRALCDAKVLVPATLPEGGTGPSAVRAQLEAAQRALDAGGPLTARRR